MVWQHYLWILFRNMSASKHIFHKSITIKFLTIHYIRYSRTTQSEENQPVNKAGLREGILRHHKRKYRHFRKLLTLHMLVFFIYFAAWTHHSLLGRLCHGSQPGQRLFKSNTALSCLLIGDYKVIGWKERQKSQGFQRYRTHALFLCLEMTSAPDVLLTVSTSSRRSSEAIEKSNSVYTCYWPQAWPNKSHQRYCNKLRRY